MKNNNIIIIVMLGIIIVLLICRGFISNSEKKISEETILNEGYTKTDDGYNYYATNVDNETVKNISEYTLNKDLSIIKNSWNWTATDIYYMTTYNSTTNIAYGWFDENSSNLYKSISTYATYDFNTGTFYCNNNSKCGYYLEQLVELKGEYFLLMK